MAQDLKKGLPRIRLLVRVTGPQHVISTKALTYQDRAQTQRQSSSWARKYFTLTLPICALFTVLHVCNKTVHFLLCFYQILVLEVHFAAWDGRSCLLHPHWFFPTRWVMLNGKTMENEKRIQGYALYGWDRRQRAHFWGHCSNNAHLQKCVPYS